jgi:hypothetical protein
MVKRRVAVMARSTVGILLIAAVFVIIRRLNAAVEIQSTMSHLMTLDIAIVALSYYAPKISFDVVTTKIKDQPVTIRSLRRVHRLESEKIDSIANFKVFYIRSEEL